MSQTPETYLAFDLGASGGRAVLGWLDNSKLRVETVRRFANSPSLLGGRLYWDFLWLWNNVVDSMRFCAAHEHDHLAGIGVDTWGVDFGLVGPDGALLGNPICHRDSLTEGVEQWIVPAVAQEELYRLTGRGIGRLSTLSQLVAMNNGPGAGVLRSAQSLLLMSDLFRHFLSGHKAIERTAAGTSQLIDVRTAR